MSINFYGGFAMATDNNNKIEVQSYIVLSDSVENANAGLAELNLKVRSLQDGWYDHKHQLSEATGDLVVKFVKKDLEQIVNDYLITMEAVEYYYVYTNYSILKTLTAAQLASKGLNHHQIILELEKLMISDK